MNIGVSLAVRSFTDRDRAVVRRCITSNVVELKCIGTCRNTADRITATSQFNTGQANTLEQFSSQLAFNRDQFNTTNALAIEQSNVSWRRDMNKIDTQATNKRMQ